MSGHGRGPLAGVRVADFSSFAVGPWAGALLGALGADVIKVDNPTGDPLRAVMPTKAGHPTTSTTVNFNKRGVILDFKNAEDHALALTMGCAADILIENYRFGVMNRLGLGYEAMAARNPRLVYISSSSFGTRGAMATVGSTDQQGQAFSGYASLSGRPGVHAEVNRHVAQIDLTTSLYVVQAALAALYHRRRTGTGQHILTSQMQAAISVQASRLGHYFATGEAPRPMGTAVPHICPSQAFQARDGRWFNVSVVRRSQWDRLCEVLELPDLASDPRFHTNALRVEHREELVPRLEVAFGGAEATHWLQKLAAAGVPSAPYLEYEDLRHHEVVLANGLLEDVPFPDGTPLHAPAVPYRFQGHDLRHGPAPVPGEHGQEVRAALARGEWPAREDAHAGTA